MGLDRLSAREREIRDWAVPQGKLEAKNSADAIATKISATYRDVFGADTVEAYEGRVSRSRFLPQRFDARDMIAQPDILRAFEG